MTRNRRGSDLARAAGNAEHANAVEAMKEQLLIVFLKRLGGELIIPASEVDDTGNDLFAFQVTPDGAFRFTVQRKQ